MTDTVADVVADRSQAGRREAVRLRVLAEGFARVDTLAQDFDVSLMTIHRDLDALETEGWLTKIRGGATANPSALLQYEVRDRSAAQGPVKAAIAKLASDLLGHGQTVFCDDSTTVLALASAITAHAPMTVATNFLPFVGAIGSADGVDLHLLGGQYHSTQQACFGLQTIEAINQFHADLFFMSTTGLTGNECYHRSESTVMVRRAFMARAARSVLLVDHAKFGRPAPHRLCGVEAFDVIVTDDGIDPVDLVGLRERCDDVRVAVST